jgi:hypothetical protein
MEQGIELYQQQKIDLRYTFNKVAKTAGIYGTINILTKPVNRYVHELGHNQYHDPVREKMQVE